MSRTRLSRTTGGLFLMIGAVAGMYGIARAVAPVASPAPDHKTIPAIVQKQLDQHIPFDLEVGEPPGPDCDPVNLELLVLTDEQGRDLDYCWCVDDHAGTRIECGDFYELYYRCDGHGCYQMRVIRRSGVQDREIVSEPVHVCLR